VTVARSKTTWLVASLAAISMIALVGSASAEAAGPFKTVTANSVPGGKVEFAGGLDVSKRCRGGRTIRFYASDLGSVYQNLPGFGTVVTKRSGAWTKTIPFRTHNVLVLVPKRAGGKTCGGGAFLVELGGPT